MGACDGRTQGASIAALSGRPRTPQRACPARSGDPCSFRWSLLLLRPFDRQRLRRRERVERPLVLAPGTTTKLLRRSRQIVVPIRVPPAHEPARARALFHLLRGNGGAPGGVTASK